MFIDNNNLNRDYTIDRLHLNNKGYLLWKQATEQYVTAQ